VLHTLHLPPLVPLMVDAVRTTEARFVTVSEAMRLDWTRAGLGRVEVGVIPNGVPAFGLPSTEVRQRALIPGRVSPEKGTAVALRMARRTGLEPLLVGGVYDQDYWEREVQVPVEPVRRKELWELMAGSAVTLMPVDWEEPFGLVAAESQMAGCPVVAYRRGGLPEVVEDGVGGFLVVPGDEDAFAAAIGAARKLDRARVRASALRRLDIEVTAARYEEALVSLRRS
jgi:glycosyltransferase involved in cell wall biosynthesis